MAGILELRELLDSMNPQLHDDVSFVPSKDSYLIMCT